MKHEQNCMEEEFSDMTRWIVSGPFELDATKRKQAIAIVKGFQEQAVEANELPTEADVDAFINFWNSVPNDGMFDDCKSHVVFGEHEMLVLNANRIGLLGVLECKLVA